MKTPSTWQQLKAILLLPFMVLVIIPMVLYFLFENNFIPVKVTIRIVSGILLLIFGLLLFVQSVILFIKIGKGTLAPWNPTQNLVVQGLYRYTRNPMILGVILMLFSEALLLNSLPILIWMFLFFIINTIYFIKKEEPDLEKKYGIDYLEYKKNVPRWIPRFTAWNLTKD